MSCKEIRFTRRKDGSDRGVAKNLEISFLLNFYGDMLTDKQRDVVELYYNEDLSLAEIAAVYLANQTSPCFLVKLSLQLRPPKAVSRRKI